jgi:hypothetical protein
MNVYDLSKTAITNHLGKIIIVIVIILFIIKCASDKPETAQDRERNFDKSNAYIASQTFVKKILRSPSTASFDDNSNNCVDKLEHNTWFVHSYVDAKNAFDGIIRQNYECKLSYNPENDMVTCISVRLIPN